MDITESIELIEDCLKEYFEYRNYNYYTIHTFMAKEKISYEQYKLMCAVDNSRIELSEIDIEERKTQAEQTLKNFIEGR